ncbi:radical SAM protein [Polyangium sp. 6x1]|uniref:radical SAM protein n=1 Tax=Polyangium sp. 6x1 TaxID=3042689 RepID=UPI0024831ED1|nr:radical SAM protein [Polyangium sp. 6x1]MDI1450008.1 radical SAM protein [Polyangium sp. 6x1]
MPPSNPVAPSPPPAGWTQTNVDGGFLRFHRDTGTLVLRRGPSTAHVRKRAPRILQIGLLTACNLRCGFCYRDKNARSLLDAPFLLDLLQKAAAWGVLEVAFGGGEPLLFKDFVPLLRNLRETTPLGLGFTTNGTFLTDAVLTELRPLVSELRVSAYPDNQYRATLRRLRGFRVGLNVLVTPANVGLIEPLVQDSLAAGANNVLLLGYKGPDPSLHLAENDLTLLRRALRRLEGLPVRFDVCLVPHLPDVPKLFDLPDCGAGDEFLAITPDRAVQVCSFQQRRIPFDTFEDLQRIYTEMRAERPHAEVRGCTRGLFSARAQEVPREETAWVWRGFASNNSGSWIVVARFCDEEAARRAAKELAEVARAHDAYLGSLGAEQWRDHEGGEPLAYLPSPPLRAFGEAHGVDWSGKDAGMNWESIGEGGPALSARTIGHAVVVYHPYCLTLPVKQIREFLAGAGATELDQMYNGAIPLRISARGRNRKAERALQAYLTEKRKTPPWGAKCKDPALEGDEDCDATLDSFTDARVEKEEGSVALDLPFRNPLAGALAVTAWLRAQGYTDIEASVHAKWKTMDGLLKVLAEEEAEFQRIKERWEERKKDPNFNPFEFWLGETANEDGEDEG